MEKITLSTMSGKNAFSKKLRNLSKAYNATNVIASETLISSPSDIDANSKLITILAPFVIKAFEHPLSSEAEQNLKKAIIAAFLASKEYEDLGENLNECKLAFLVDELVSFCKMAHIVGDSEESPDTVAEVRENKTLARIMHITRSFKKAISEDKKGLLNWAANTYAKQVVSQGINIAVTALCTTLATTMPILAGSIALAKFIVLPLLSAAAVEKVNPSINKGINTLVDRAKNTLSGIRNIMPKFSLSF